MNTKNQSDVKGLWAILWRSLFFVPYMLFVFVVIGGIYISRWILPIYGTLMLYAQELWTGALTFFLWLVTAWAYRRFQLKRFFDTASSFL